MDFRSPAEFLRIQLQTCFCAHAGGVSLQPGRHDSLSESISLRFPLAYRSLEKTIVFPSGDHMGLRFTSPFFSGCRSIGSLGTSAKIV